MNPIRKNIESIFGSHAYRSHGTASRLVSKKIKNRYQKNYIWSASLNIMNSIGVMNKYPTMISITLQGLRRSTSMRTHRNDAV